MPSIVDNVTIASQTHTQRFIPASFIAGSISVLNPNDGIAYIARDRDCLSANVGAWDWKVPSQSYAYLPGPFRSVGIFYLDRSGASLPGDIATYASTAKLDLPVFHAIGRAQVSIVTTLDIGQGSQPSVPAAGSVRLWADPNGDLHILSAGGTDNLVYDASNIGTVSLGGDLYGTIAVGHVRGLSIDATPNVTVLNVLYLSNTNAYLLNVGGAIRYAAAGVHSFESSSAGGPQSVQCGPLTVSGGATVTGDLTISAGHSLIWADSNHKIWDTQAGVNGPANNMYFDEYGAFNWRSMSRGGAISMSLDTNANLTVYGHTMISQQTGGVASTGSSEGQIELQNNGSGASKIAFHRTGVYALYLGLDTDNVVRIGGWSMGGVAYRILMGDEYTNPGNIRTAGSVYVGGGVFLPNGQYIYWNNTTNYSIYGDTAQLQFSHSANLFRFYVPGTSFTDVGLTGLSNGAWSFGMKMGGSVGVGQGFCVGGTNLNGQSFFCAGGSGGPTGWQIISTRRYKSNIQPITNALSIVLGDVHGYHFDLDFPQRFKLKTREDEPDEPFGPQPQYGFIGEEWETVAPDVLDKDEDKQVRMMDYGQVNAILFEAFKEYVKLTDARLDALEKLP